MLQALILLLAIQSPRMGSARGSATSVAGDLTNGAIMPPGVKEHFADGITIIGKLVWPSDMTPTIIDIELEDEMGNVFDSTKSEPNNQFRFTRVPIINPVDSSYRTFYIVISTESLNIVHQQLSLSTNNFAGAQVTVQLKRLPGLVSRNSEAVISLASFKPEPPRDALAAFDKAMEEQRKGDLKKSAANFEKALKIAPDFYEANLELGLQYDKNGEPDEGTRLLNRALELNPASMRARAALGQRAFEKNDFEKAATLLEEAVQLGNTSADVYFMLGSSYKEIDEADLAESSLRRALVISPGMGKVHLALHNVYIKRRQLDKALIELDTFLQQYPDAADRERIQAAADKLRKALRP